MKVNNCLSLLVFSIFLFFTPTISHADTSIYRSAGWVATDGSPAYSDVTGCQISNDGLYCSRPLAASNARLYFSSFGNLENFGIPSGSFINKLHIRIKGKNSVSQLIGVSASKNNVPVFNTCQLPTDIWQVNLGSSDLIKEFHTFTSSNGLTDCVTASNIDSEKITFVLGYSSQSSSFNWNADIDNFEIAFDYSPPTYPWNNKGQLNRGRLGHSATLLSSGKVLVVGGDNSGNRISHTEVYDPSNGIWSSVTFPSDVRIGHTAYLVTVNKTTGKTATLIFGGLDSNLYTNKTELYDPEANAWRSAPNMNSKRYLHGSSVLEDGKVFVTGGYIPTILNTTEIYDPVANTWTNKASMINARRLHTQVTFKDAQGNSKVMVMGGLNSTGTQLKSTEIYDPLSDAWTAAPDMNYTRFSASAVTLSDGRILVVGGNSNVDNTSEVYSPSDNSWRIYNTSFPTRLDVEIALLGSSAGNKVLATGGSGVTDAQLFDPLTNTWSTTASMNSPRSGFTLTTLKDGSVLAAAGGATYTQTTTSEVYTPAQVLGDTTTPTPTPIPSLSPTPVPFLDLPWDYTTKGKTFNDAAMAINSYFDHEYPFLSGGLSEGGGAFSNTLVTYEGSDRKLDGRFSPQSKYFYSAHDGYDYGSWEAGVAGGDPVYPAAPGEAKYVYSVAAGHTIQITHPEGYQTRYLHLQDTPELVKTKRHVERDTVIGLVGSTGTHTTGPHIHFGVYQDKDKDGNYTEEVPYGATDPFGWEPEKDTNPQAKKNPDPWENYKIAIGGQEYTGNKSHYLWKIGIDKILVAVPVDGGKVILGPNELDFPQGSSATSFNVSLQSSPYVKTIREGKQYKSILPGIKASAYGPVGNLIEDFLAQFTLKTDFTESEIYNIRPETLFFYSSDDGITWVKEETIVDFQKNIATAKIKHFSYFALMGEVADAIAPITTENLDGSKGKEGQYRSDVLLSLNTEDNESGLGVDYRLYKIEGEEWENYTTPLIFTKEGTHEVQFYSGDKGRNVEDVKTVEFQIDKTTPVTSASLDGTEGEEEWYTSDVLISLSALDEGGVDKIEYSLDGGVNYVEYKDPFNVGDEESREIFYRSVDTAGNVEVGKKVGVKIDQTVPDTLVYTTGVKGDGGWYRSDVEVAFNAHDSGSGYHTTFYSFDGDDFVEYAEPLTITVEGITKVIYYSVDKAGNMEDEGVFEVKIDKTAPEVEMVYDTGELNYKFEGKESGSGVVLRQVAYTNNTGEVKIQDKAGNMVRLKIKERVKGKNAELTLDTIAYNDASLIDLTKNGFSVKYDVNKENVVKKYEQIWHERDDEKIKLEYLPKDDQTKIVVKNDDNSKVTTLELGQKVLRVTTDNGELKYSY